MNCGCQVNNTSIHIANWERFGASGKIEDLADDEAADFQFSENIVARTRNLPLTVPWSAHNVSMEVKFATNETLVLVLEPTLRIGRGFAVVIPPFGSTL